MAAEPYRRSLTRRHLLLGATAIAANALVAACGSNVPVTPAATAIPAAGTRLASNLATTTVPTEAAALLPPPPATVSTTLATPMGTPTTPLIVFLGGYNMVANPRVQRTETLPAQTMALLAPAKFDAVDLSSSDETVATLNLRASRTFDPLYAASRRTNILVLFAGHNDLYFGSSVAETFPRMVMFGQARRRVGWKVVWLTLIPALASVMRRGEDFVTERQAINAMMRQNRGSFADALADVGADPTIGVEGAAANPDYFQDDGWTLTAKGYNIAAGIVKAAILTL